MCKCLVTISDSWYRTESSLLIHFSCLFFPSAPIKPILSHFDLLPSDSADFLKHESHAIKTHTQRWKRGLCSLNSRGEHTLFLLPPLLYSPFSWRHFNPASLLIGRQSREERSKGVLISLYLSAHSLVFCLLPLRFYSQMRDGMW